MFELTPQRGGFTHRVIYNFQGQRDGEGPDALARDRAGALYGVSSPQSKYLFRIAPTAHGYVETTLFHFPALQQPSAPLTIAPDGTLYGTAISFSAHGRLTYGMVLRFDRSIAGLSERILHNFQTLASGVSPRAPLLVDRSGIVYGATAFGGLTTPPNCINRGCGTIFRLVPSRRGYQLETLYRFTGGRDGFVPSALTGDASGVLYGATSFGGTQACPDGSCGTVFAFDVAKRSLKVLHAFSSDGLWYPSGPPALDARGFLYGIATQYGPSNTASGAYELAPTMSGYVERVVHVFAGPPGDGTSPNPGLLLGPFGKMLYGTTYWGGHGLGTAFALRI